MNEKAEVFRQLKGLLKLEGALQLPIGLCINATLIEIEALLRLRGVLRIELVWDRNTVNPCHDATLKLTGEEHYAEVNFSPC